MTALIGVVVVFATLVVLTLIFILFGKVMHRPKEGGPGRSRAQAETGGCTEDCPHARRAGRYSGRGGGGHRGGGGFHGARGETVRRTQGFPRPGGPPVWAAGRPGGEHPPF